MKVLLEKFFGGAGRPIKLVIDGLGSYELVKIVYRDIEHVMVRPRENNQCESEFSLFEDFLRSKRWLKSIDNLEKYVNGFYVIRNLLKQNNNNTDQVIRGLRALVTTS